MVSIYHPKRTLLILLSLLFLPLLLTAQRYELVWSDEFDGEQLDVANTWNVWRGTAYNNELQCYTDRPENVYLENGNLVLMARRENRFCNGRTMNYTSARIATDSTRIGWEYGRFEARIKMPNGQGFWPAFWLMPMRTIGWPRGGEIDIMEFRGNVPQVTTGAIHYWRAGCTGTSTGCRSIKEGSLATGTDLTAGFHLYSLEWTPETMRWFFDDVQFLEVKRADIAAEFEPFTGPFYIILNLAVGGNFLPDPDANTPFPMALMVDYVRVYQDVNEPPTFNFDDTSARLVPAGEPVQFSVQASDTDGTLERVVLTVNGEEVAQKTEPPFVFELGTPMEGCYEIGGFAVDNDGGRSSSVAPVQLTVGDGCTAASYNETPFSLPATIPFWQFNKGGQGIGYFDTTPGVNQGVAAGAVPRPFDAVDTRETVHPDTDFSVFEAVSGEWLTYDFVTTRDTVIDIEMDVMAAASSSLDILLNETFQFSFNRIRSADTLLTLSRTGIAVPAGQHRLKVTVRTGNLELLVMRLRHSTPVSVAEGLKNQEIPNEIVLKPVYPNPFNPTTTIGIQMQQPAPVLLRVFDTNGRLIETLMDRQLPAGLHQVKLSMEQHSSGVYLVVLHSDQVRLSQYITLMK